MKRKTKTKVIMASALLVGGLISVYAFLQSSVSGTAKLDGIETVQSDHGAQLQVPLEATEAERLLFMSEFIAREGFQLRDIYEKWIDVIGANGLIEEVHRAYPTCHDEGHDLGKVIYARLGNIAEALRTCEEACYSGCMHGVTMEAFAVEKPGAPGQDLGVWDPGAHVEIEDVESKIGEMCGDEVFDDGESYSIGDCAHGVGHALMFITEYKIDAAMDLCSLFDSDILDYYCATGAYMEYVSQNPDAMDNEEDPLNFAPCDSVQYPAACFRYKLPRSMYFHYKAEGTFGDFYRACQALEGNYRVACMHGFGNAHIQFLVRKELTLKELCDRGSYEEQYVCIEGAMERIARYHPDVAPVLCLDVDGWQREVCIDAVENELYSLDKPFDLYLR